MSAPEGVALAAAVCAALREEQVPKVPPWEAAEAALVGVVVLLDALGTGRSALTGDELGESLGMAASSAHRALWRLTLAGVLLRVSVSTLHYEPNVNVSREWTALRDAWRERRAAA